MANTLSVRLTLDAGGYTKGINDASNATKQYTNQVSKLTQNLPNLRKENRQLKNETQNLALAISRLTEEEKNSAEGRAMIEHFQQLQRESAKLVDMLGDVTAQTKNLASDTANLDAFNQGFQVLGNTMSGVAGIMSMITGNTEDMQKAIAMYTTVQSVANTVTGIANALNKNSILMLKLKALQQKAAAVATNIETAAQGKNIVVTKAATVAQRAFNTVAQANPYVLIAAAIAAVTLAMIGLMDATDDATDSIDDHAEELKHVKEVAEDFAQSAGQEYGNLRGSYERLREEYNKLTTELQKTQFIQNHRNEINKLTDAVDDASSADDFFKNKTGEVLKAFDLRAQAAAAAAMAIKKYAQAEEIMLMRRSPSSYEGTKISVETYNKLPQSLKNKAEAITEEGKYTPGIAPGMAGSYSEIRTTGYYLRNVTEAEAEWLANNNMFNTRLTKELQQAQKEAKYFNDRVTALTNQLEGMTYGRAGGNSPSHRGTHSGHSNNHGGSNNDREANSNDIKEAKTQLEQLKEQRDAIKKEMEKMVVNQNGQMVILDEAKYNKAKEDLEKINKLIEEGEKLLGDLPSMLEIYEHELEELEKKQPFVKTTQDAQALYKNIKAKKEDIRLEKIRIGQMTELEAIGERIQDEEQLLQFTTDPQEIFNIRKNLMALKKQEENEKIKLGLEISEGGEEAIKNELERLDFLINVAPDQDSKQLLKDQKKDYEDLADVLEKISKLQEEIDDLVKEQTLTTSEYNKAALQHQIDPLQNRIDELNKIKEKLEYALNVRSPYVYKLKEEELPPMPSVEMPVEVVPDFDGMEGGEIPETLVSGIGKKFLDAIEEQWNKFAEIGWDKLSDQRTLEGRMSPKELDVYKTKSDTYNTATTEIQKVLDAYDMGALAKEDAMHYINVFNEMLEKIGLEPIEVTINWRKFDEDARKVSNTIGEVSSSIASAFGAINDLFKSNSDDNKDNIAMKAAQIIAQAIATLALSFAQAMADAKTHAGGIWTWIAGGISGMATLLTMTAQLSSLKKDTNGYATGGVVGGHSYYGDRILIRANSGELILNKKQQQRVWSSMNTPDNQGLNTHLTGNVIVKGSDLNIALTNQYKKQNKSR